MMPEFGLQMREILRRVVTHGTGRRARAELYLTLGTEGTKDEKKVRIPAFGKTGTTNDYNNANFAGFIPYPTEKGQPLDPENAYVLAAYTGYDLNKSMQNGAIKVSGAIGALPAWIGLGKEIIDKKKYADFIDLLDIGVIARQEWPIKRDSRATQVTVDMPRGVILGGGAGEQEAIALSDSSREGESAFDEYRASVVQTTLTTPLQGAGVPFRMFSPYRLEVDGKRGEPILSKVGPVGPGEPAERGGATAQPTKTGAPDPSASVPVGGGAPPTPGPAPVGSAAPPSGDSDLGEGRYEDSPAAMMEASGAKPEAKGAGQSEDLFKDATPEGRSPAKAPAGQPKTSSGGFVEEELW